MENRFEKIYSQNQGFLGSMERSMEIWLDRETGVQYLYRRDGYSGGMTVLLDGAGKPLKAAEPQEDAVR